MNMSKLHLAFVLVLALLLPLNPLHAQLGPGSAAALGTGNNYTALARGVSALGYNPAGLGMPGTPGFSLSLLPVMGWQGMDPIGLSDLKDVEGELISNSTKDSWIRDIASAGEQTGGFGADLTPVAFNVGPIGFQFSTMIRGEGALNERGAELLLYGNAGKTGQAQDYDLANSRLSGVVVSTLGIGYGHALSIEGEAGSARTLAVGGTFKYSVGHGVAYGQDAGSQVRADPLEGEIEFPIIVTDEVDDQLNFGSGFGLDLGAVWEEGDLSVGVSIQNLFHTFEWELDDMSFIAGEFMFNEDDTDSDFDTRPAEQAPSDLQDAVTDLKFKPQISVGLAYDLNRDLTVMGDVRKRLGDGIEVGPDLHVGLGLEFNAIDFLPLRVGAAKITDGFQFGGGFGLVLGPVNLNWAGALQKGDLDGSVAAFSISFGGF